MKNVIDGFIGSKCQLYLDDVIVFGYTFQEVYDNLQAILLCFRHNNLKLKSKKCHFFQRKVNFLGHVVFEEGTIQPWEDWQDTGHPPFNWWDRCEEYLGIRKLL